MRNELRLAAMLIVIGLLSSCVGNRKMVYLQDKEAKGGDRYFPVTEVATPEIDNKLERGDVLYIRIEKFQVGQELFAITNLDQSVNRFQVQNPYLIGYVIDGEGYVTLPLLGKITAEGSTLEEFKLALNERAASEYPGAKAEVFQLDGSVSILGEVANAGRYNIFKQRNTILDVIADAGDLLDFADRSTVRIIRESNGVQKVLKIDLNDVNALSQEGFILKNNDVIIVSPLKRRKYTTANIQWLVSSITALVAVSSLVLSITR